MNELKWLRVAIVLMFVGIVSELVALMSLTPPTFLAFVIGGIPCMGVAMLIYVAHVLRQLRKKGAL